MKKFGMLLMFLSLSWFAIGCGTDDTTTPANGVDNTEMDDADDGVVEEENDLDADL